MKHSPERDPRRRLEPARCDVPRGEGRIAASRSSASSAWRASSTRRASRPSSRRRLDVSVKDVTAVVLGGHGDQMVPVVSATNVGGVPLPELVCRRRRIRKLVERTKVGGGELVELLGTVGLVRARRRGGADGRLDLPRREARSCPARRYLEGEYGIDGLYMGVPVKLGAAGVEEIVKLRLERGREEDAARVRGRGTRGRRRAEDGSSEWISVSPAGTAIVCGASSGHRPRHRRVARERGRERRHVRAAAASSLEREAKRLGGARRRRRRHEPRRSRASRADDRSIRYGGVDILVNNPAGRRERPRAELDAEQVEAAVAAAARLGRAPDGPLPAVSRAELRGAHRQRDVVRPSASRSTTSRSRTSSGLASSAGRSRSRASSGRRGSRSTASRPGRIDTDRIREVYPDGLPQEDLAAIPLRRLARPRARSATSSRSSALSAPRT